jgi:hypothetical protein
MAGGSQSTIRLNAQKPWIFYGFTDSGDRTDIFSILRFESSKALQTLSIRKFPDLGLVENVGESYNMPDNNTTWQKAHPARKKAYPGRSW